MNLMNRNHHWIVIKNHKVCQHACFNFSFEMFLKGSINGQDIDNTSDNFVKPWLETIKKIAPREVMIYTIDRETPVKTLEKASHEELDRILSLLHAEGIKATASY